MITGGSGGTYVRPSGGSSGGTYIRPSGQYVYYEEDLSNGQVMDVTDRYVVREPARRTVKTVKAPVKTLTSNGSIISTEPSVLTLPRQQEKIVTRVLPSNPPTQRVRRVVQSPVVVPQGGYRTVIDSSRGVIRNSGTQVVREVVQPRYVQQPHVVQQVVRRSVPSKKYYVTKSSDYTSSSDSSSSDSDDERTLISKGEVVHAVIRDNWSFKKEPKEEKIITKVKNKDRDDDAASSASSSSLESRKLKILEQVRDNGVENGQVIVNDNGTPVIVKMRGNKKDKKSKKERKKEEGNFMLY